MAYVLIILILSYHTGAATPVQFADLSACEKARDTLNAVDRVVLAQCFPVATRN